MGKSSGLKCAVILILCLVLAFSANPVLASTNTVEEQEPKYKVVTRPSERFLTQRAVQSKNKLSADSIAGITMGLDTNPLFNSAKKSDGYVQETAGMHFKYPINDFKYGPMGSCFGFDLTNINYFKVTDVNIFDGTAYAGVEQELFDIFTAGVGYGFEGLWFPCNRDGTFIGNEVNASIKHKITKRIYQKATYRYIARNYTDRKARLANGNEGSKLREDQRNLIEHELGFFPTDITKLKMINQIYFNNSNDQYNDYYDYLNYRIGGTIVQFFNPKFYTITGFYYQIRNYDSRICSDKWVVQKDKQYTVTTSLLYDFTKDISAFVNYTYTENQSNEPLERYTDNLYTAGIYYMF